MHALQREAQQPEPQGLGLPCAAVHANGAVNALPQAWAVKLIDALHLTYGTRFLQAWERIDMAKLAWHWGEEMAGFTEAEIAAGLSACKTRPWPPTLPEFMFLCRPWLEPEIAFQQAVKGMMSRRQGKQGYWAHPAVYWTAQRLGEHDMLSGSWQTLKTRWEAAFRHLLAQNDWHPIPAPAVQLPAPGAASLSREEANRLAAQVRQMTGETATPGGNVTDHKAWARRILANPKGRTIAVIRSAQQALGLDVGSASTLGITS